MKLPFIILAALVLAFAAVGCGALPPAANVPKNTLVATPNDNANTDQNANVNSAGTPVTYQGTVFVKGYKTPSESFGMLIGGGLEIGLGSYDSKREQFRPYIGDQIEVTFSSFCKSATENCCRTLFAYCGSIASWKPLTATQ